jgi:hypothetical protein
MNRLTIKHVAFGIVVAVFLAEVALMLGFWTPGW